MHPVQEFMGRQLIDIYEITPLNGRCENGQTIRQELGRFIRDDSCTVSYPFAKQFVFGIMIVEGTQLPRVSA